MKDKSEKLGFFQLIQSVLACFIGIQSEEKREQDFQKITKGQILLGGLILTAFFFGTVMAIVHTLLATYT